MYTPGSFSLGLPEMGSVNHGRILRMAVLFVWSISVSMTTAQGNATTVQAMWPDYAIYSSPSGPGGIIYFTAIPFTYYESITNTIDLNLGYVTFGGEYRGAQPPPPAEWPANPKILGIYWTPVKIDADKARNSSYYYYDAERLNNVTYENSLIKYVKGVISEADFEPLAIFAMTWRNISPISHKDDTAAFQAIIATDSQVTYVIRVYESVWKSLELASQTYYAATYSRGYGQRPHISIAGSQKGPEVIRLGTKKPTRDPYTCVQKAQTAIARLNSSLNLLPPCPCFQVQAARDPQFNTSSTYPNCYQSVSPPPGGSLLQFCCYSHRYGVLINYTKEARVPVSADPSDRSLQEAFERCCADGSGLCDWFYYRIPTIQCANYTPAVNASELPRFVNRDDERVYRSQGLTTREHFTFRNTSSVILRVSTNFNSLHGFSADSTSFTWDLGAGRDELRKVSYPQRLVFYATDVKNMSSSFAPIYKLCLCEQDVQCDVTFFSISVTRQRLGMNTFIGLDNYEPGNVNSMVCNCGKNGTGRFCEKPINVCDNCLIQNASVCDTNPMDYCPPCPFGYQRDGTQCRVFTYPSRGDNSHSDSAYLVIILACLASFTMWIQKPLASDI